MTLRIITNQPTRGPRTEKGLETVLAEKISYIQARLREIPDEGKDVEKLPESLQSVAKGLKEFEKTVDQIRERRPDLSLQKITAGLRKLADTQKNFEVNTENKELKKVVGGLKIIPVPNRVGPITFGN